MRVWTSGDVLFLLMRICCERFQPTSHDCYKWSLKPKIPCRKNIRDIDKIQYLNFLVSLANKSFKIFPAVTMPNRKHIVVYLESSFTQFSLSKSPWQLLSYTQTPHGLSTWPLQTLQRLLSFVTAYTQFSGVPLITVGLKRCRFVQEDSQKRNLKTPD